MKFLIENTTSDNKFITRFGGQKICIPKHDFIEFDSDDALECTYWSNLITNPINGINIITDANRIKLLNKLKSCGKYNNIAKSKITKKVEISKKVNNVEIVEKAVKTPETPNKSTTESKRIVENVVETVNEIKEAKDVVENIVENVENMVEENDVLNTVIKETSISDIKETVEESKKEQINVFTKESLSNKSKEELQEILNTYGVEYKKNNSINTLINLIIENCK